VAVQCSAVRHCAVRATTGTGVTVTAWSSAVTRPQTSGTLSARTSAGSATSETAPTRSPVRPSRVF